MTPARRAIVLTPLTRPNRMYPTQTPNRVQRITHGRVPSSYELIYSENIIKILSTLKTSRGTNKLRIKEKKGKFSFSFHTIATHHRIRTFWNAYDLTFTSRVTSRPTAVYADVSDAVGGGLFSKSIQTQPFRLKTSYDFDDSVVSYTIAGVLVVIVTLQIDL